MNYKAVSIRVSIRTKGFLWGSLALALTLACSVAQAPTRTGSGIARARYLVEQGNWFEAASVLREHLADNSDDTGSRYDLADVLFRLGKYPEAAEEALAVPVDDPVYGLRRQHLLMRLRMRAARELNWNDSGEILGFARLCARMGSYERSGRAYRRLLTDRDDPDLRREYATMLMWAGDHETAARQWTRYIEAVPADGDAYHRLARVYMSQGWLTEAESALRQSLRLQPAAPAVRLDMARVWIWQNETVRADRELMDLLAQGHDPIETGLLRCELLLRLSRVVEAHELLEEVVRMAPQNAGAQRLLRELNESRRVEIAQLRMELAERPEMEEERRRLIDILLEVRRPGAALREMQELYFYRPGDPVLGDRIRRLKAQQRLTVQELMSTMFSSFTSLSGSAMELMAAWIEQHPDDQRAADLLADALKRIGPPGVPPLLEQGGAWPEN